MVVPLVDSTSTLVSVHHPANHSLEARTTNSHHNNNIATTRSSSSTAVQTSHHPSHYFSNNNNSNNGYYHDCYSDNQTKTPPTSRSDHHSCASFQPTAIRIGLTTSATPTRPTAEKEQEEFLWLPNNTADSTSSLLSVDECLSSLPLFQRAAHEFRQLPLTQYDTSTAASSFQTSPPLLYVTQGEVAHFSCAHHDIPTTTPTPILLSDRATTCHILILRSITKDAFNTLTHLDSTQYDLSELFQEHIDFHHKNVASRIQMDVHVMGGYCDERGTSSELTHWLFHSLATMARNNEHLVSMTLRTCVVTSLNHNNHDVFYTTHDRQPHLAPCLRGMALEVHTGRVFPARVSDFFRAGPCMHERSARLWTQQPQQPQRLYRIYPNHSKDKTTMMPWISVRSAAPPETDALLALPDDLLLQCTSTSPDCEEDDFCHVIRETLLFLKKKQKNFEL